jgi:hypothetical protein
MKNLIQLDHNKSYTEDGLLFIDGKSYNFDGTITIFKTENQYKEENSGIEFAQNHFDYKLVQYF